MARNPWAAVLSSGVRRRLGGVASAQGSAAGAAARSVPAASLQ